MLFVVASSSSLVSNYDFGIAVKFMKDTGPEVKRPLDISWMCTTSRWRCMVQRLMGLVKTQPWNNFSVITTNTPSCFCLKIVAIYLSPRKYHNMFIILKIFQKMLAIKKLPFLVRAVFMHVIKNGTLDNF